MKPAAAAPESCISAHCRRLGIRHRRILSLCPAHSITSHSRSSCSCTRCKEQCTTCASFKSARLLRSCASSSAILAANNVHLHGSGSHGKEAYAFFSVLAPFSLRLFSSTGFVELFAFTLKNAYALLQHNNLLLQLLRIVGRNGATAANMVDGSRHFNQRKIEP